MANPPKKKPTPTSAPTLDDTVETSREGTDGEQIAGGEEVTPEDGAEVTESVVAEKLDGGEGGSSLVDSSDVQAEVLEEAEVVEEPARDPHLPFIPPTVEELAPLFPNLEIHEVIAAGGMGAVYRVRQPQLDRFVALKILPPESGQESEYVERFGREAKLMAQLNHPNIVGIYDFGNTGGLFYFIMEFVDGQTLHEAIQASPVPPQTARLLMLQIAKGLKYAHDKGVLHLDIKPGNLMISGEGVVKILDFGLANLVGHDDEEAFGTPHYTAPERYTAGAAFDHRADLFSLGAVFYELLTQVPPSGQYAPASEVAGSPPAFDSIINKCLQTDPEKRYKNGGELGADLAKAKNARAATQLVKTAGTTVSKTGAGADYKRALEESQKKKALVGGIFAGIVGIGLIVGLIMLLAGGPDPDPNEGGGNGGGGTVVTPPPTPPDPPTPPIPTPPVVDPPSVGGEVDKSPASIVRLKGDGERYIDFPEAPRLAGRALEVDVLFETGPTDGVIVKQGGEEIGYSLYLQGGYAYFAVRSNPEKLTSVRSPEILTDKIVSVGGKLDEWGAMSLTVNGKVVAEASAGRPFETQPRFGLLVGTSGRSPVGNYGTDSTFDGYIQEVVIRTAPVSGSGPFDGPFDR